MPELCTRREASEAAGPQPVPLCRRLDAVRSSSKLLSGPRVAALKNMQEDPDPMVSCLATQTLYILEAKEKLQANTSTSCFCGRRAQKSYS